MKCVHATSSCGPSNTQHTFFGFLILFPEDRMWRFPGSYSEGSTLEDDRTIEQGTWVPEWPPRAILPWPPLRTVTWERSKILHSLNHYVLLNNLSLDSECTISHHAPLEVCIPTTLNFLPYPNTACLSTSLFHCSSQYLCLECFSSLSPAGELLLPQEFSSIYLGKVLFSF